MLTHDILKNIKERIEEGKRKYRSGEIRGELLKRNPKFKRHLNQVIRFASTDDRWLEFCRQWGIAEQWNGDLEALADHASSLPWIYVNRDDRVIETAKKNKRQGPQLKAYGYAMGIGTGKLKSGDFLRCVNPVLNDLQSTMFDRKNKPYPGGEIFVKIFPWTALQELKYIWLALKYEQKKTFGFALTGREKRTFERDLCFYDLHKEKRYGKLNDRRIASAWEHYTGEKVPLKTITKARERIAASIKALGR